VFVQVSDLRDGRAKAGSAATRAASPHL